MNVYINKPFLYRNDLYKGYFEFLKNYFVQKNFRIITDKIHESVDTQYETIVVPKNYNIGSLDLKNIYVEDNFYKCLDKIFLLSNIVVILPTGEANNCEVYTIIIKNKDIPIYILNINHYFDNLLNYLERKSVNGYKVVEDINELIEEINHFLDNQKVKKLS